MRIFLVTLVGLFMGFQAFAGELHGEAGAGAIYITGTDRTSVSDKTSAAVTANGSSYSETMPALFFKMSYKASDNSEIYAGIPIEDLDPKLKLGGKYQSSAGETELYAHFSLMKEIWDNPYSTEKSETDLSENGFGLKHSFKNGFGAEYIFTSVNVKDDKLGEAHSELDRSGQRHQVELSYVHTLDGKNILIPAFYMGISQMKGEAQQSIKAGLKTAYLHNISGNVLTFAVSAESERFVEENPVFMKKRSDNSASMYVSFRKNGIGGSEAVFLSGGLFYMHKNSNISFYDSDATGVIFTAGYQF